MPGWMKMVECSERLQWEYANEGEEAHRVSLEFNEFRMRLTFDGETTEMLVPFEVHEGLLDILIRRTPGWPAKRDKLLAELPAIAEIDLAVVAQELADVQQAIKEHEDLADPALAPTITSLRNNMHVLKNALQGDVITPAPTPAEC